MILINYKTNINLNFSKNRLIVANNADKATPFSIPVYIYVYIYVPVVTLSTQINAKLPDQIKHGLKRTIIWYKYQSK